MKKKIFTIIEYKRRSETWPDYRERGEEKAREQYETVREPQPEFLNWPSSYTVLLQYVMAK